MNPDFGLSESDADQLCAEFRKRRDVADAAGLKQEAAIWSSAFRLLTRARMAAFQRAEKAAEQSGTDCEP